MTPWTFFSFSKAEKIIFKAEKQKRSIYLHSALTVEKIPGVGWRKCQKGRDSVPVPAGCVEEEVLTEDSEEAILVQNILPTQEPFQQRTQEPFSLWGPGSCFSPQIFIKICWAVTVWLSLLLCCCVSWVTTFFHWLHKRWLYPWLAWDHSFEERKMSGFRERAGISVWVTGAHLKCGYSNYRRLSDNNRSLSEDVASNHPMWNA